MVVRSFFFCKQKTAYEMRISDWSSDVCSSDLVEQRAAGCFRAPGGASPWSTRRRTGGSARRGTGSMWRSVSSTWKMWWRRAAPAWELGRAECRERGRPYVELSGVGVSFNNKTAIIAMPNIQYLDHTLIA